MNANDRLAKRREARNSYHGKPRFRKAAVLQRILGVSFGVPFAVAVGASYAIPFLDPLLGYFGILSIFAVLLFTALSGILFACAMTLTGPVYKNQIDPVTNDLETWGLADRLAAAAITALAIAGLTWIGFRLTGILH